MQNGKERRFILSEENTISIENGELFIGIEYRIDDQGRKQDEITRETVQAVLQHNDIGQWKLQLARLAPTEREPERTVLEKHLKEYAARNTFDYFIHRDLGTFLRRELDFFIKNEVLVLDDIIDRKPKDFEKRLAKLNALRTIGHKIITFLAQLEDFQKKLWLKKKFVIETQYCITLDRVPESLYPEIAKNDDQREEWVRLFAIDELKGDLAGGVNYSKPLKPEFLKANPFLLLDTRFFDADFKRRLLAEIDDLDAQTDGLMIHSDNFQALGLLQEKYRGELTSIYADPPYNTDAGPILYKNGYRSSSWISMLSDRLKLSHKLLNKDGIACVTIDDYQQKELHFLIEEIWGQANIAGTVAIRVNPSGRPTQTGFALAHEYAIFARKEPTAIIQKMERTEKQMERYGETDEDGSFEWRNFRREGSNSEREKRRRLFYPIFVTPNSLRIPASEWDDKKEEWILQEKPKADEQVIFPVNDDGEEKTWRWEQETVKDNIEAFCVKNDRSGKLYAYYKCRPNSEGVVPVTIWFDSKYSATEHGTGVLKKLFKTNVFSYPKSIYAVEDCLSLSGMRKDNTVCLDFFAGSGTTGHAVINLNREDKGKRKYILIEMGEYFDEITKPRIQKVIYSQEWKDGKPVGRKGSSHCLKYIRLESYEDALNNLVLQRSGDQQGALDMNPSKKFWVREDKVAAQVEAALERITIKDHEMMTAAIAAVKEANKAKQESHNREVGLLKKEHSEIQAKLDRLVDLLAEGVLPPEDYRTKREQLKKRQHDLVNLIHAYDDADNMFGSTMEKLMKVAMGAHKAFLSSSVEEKRELLNFVFSNLTLKGETLCYSYNFPFNNFENLDDCSKWRSGEDSNLRYGVTRITV